MGQLINDLLSLSRITRSDLTRQPVNLSELVQSIAAELQTRDSQREVECVITEPMIVQADARLLRIALQNLLENAWKFTGTRQQAIIEVGQISSTEYQARHADWALSQPNLESSHEQIPIYYIRDNGVGFDMSYSAKLFTPFQRLHGMHEFPGTGIGLAIIHRVISRHGGQIWPEAAVDQGATFYFTISPRT